MRIILCHAPDDYAKCKQLPNDVRTYVTIETPTQIYYAEEPVNTATIIERFSKPGYAPPEVIALSERKYKVLEPKKQAINRHDFDLSFGVEN